MMLLVCELGLALLSESRHALLAVSLSKRTCQLIATCENSILMIFAQLLRYGMIPWERSGTRLVE